METILVRRIHRCNSQWLPFVVRIVLLLGILVFPLGTNQVMAQEGVPNPWLIAFPENDAVEGWEWPEGSTVSLSIEDLNTAISPDFTGQADAAVTDWGDPRTYFRIDFAGAYDLKVDDVVTLSYETTTRSHTVKNLAITNVDAVADTITGSADAGVLVQVWPHGYDVVATVNATTLEDSTWTAEFQGLIDLEAGIGGRSWIVDEANATAVDWYVPNPPRIFAQFTDDSIRYEYNQPGTSVTLSIYTAPGGELMWENTQDSDEGGFTHFSIWDYRVDLQPGMLVVASDGTWTNELVLEHVSLDTFDPEGNVITGIADPGRAVWVGGMNETTTCEMEVFADDSGSWTADFDIVPCDLTDDMNVFAQVMDAEGDTSEAFMDFIDGSHDYDTGDVPSWACNAGGWAVDTDDRSRNLEVRILSDGTEVASTVADLPSDLTGVCGNDGTCAFEVNLWGLITSYEEHWITAQALDAETGEWFDLYNSPHPLTCRTYDIYIYDTETGATTQLTNLGDSNEWNPRWSPDGKKIVHDRWTVDWENLGVHITDVKTGESKLLAGAEGGNYPTWSPNGQRIAFNIGESLYTLPPTGGEPRLVRDDAFMASWSPNSKRLVFNRPSDGSIRTMDLTSGDEQFVAYGNGPAWSPDGEWIAYEYDGDLWKIRVDSQGVGVGQPVRLTSDAGYEGRPSWSNNGKTIVYHAGVERWTDIWTISADGGLGTWLTGGESFGDYDPNYSFNGRYIAYSSYIPITVPPEQQEKLWAAAFTYDVPAGFWTEGTHPYHFELQWSYPEPGFNGEQGGEFEVSYDAPLYDGYVLLRGPFELCRVIEDEYGNFHCEEVEAIHPMQPTRFLIGWVFDNPVTYGEAFAQFYSLTGKVVWDEGQSEALTMHEIRPFYWGDDWWRYVCYWTIQ